MLDFFHGLAHRLAPYRKLLWAVVLLSMGVFVAVLTASAAPREDAFALLSITALIWSLLLITIAHSFAGPSAARAPETGLWPRIKWRLRRGVLWMLALAMAALCAVVTAFSFRAIGTLLG